MTSRHGQQSAASRPSHKGRRASSSTVSPTTAAPAARTFFDPWNSSSTGHQRAENRLSRSTSWRAARNLKLGEQYKGGLRGGGEPVADAVGAGSDHFGTHGRLRTGGQKSLAEVWGATKAGSNKSSPDEAVDGAAVTLDAHVRPARTRALSDQDQASDAHVQNDDAPPPDKQIFAGLCFYINGSTAPLVSDHKLKHMLAARGARHSIALARRSVTHVLLGRTANSQGGAGGGLAATKIQKEISKSGGKAVKFISTEW
ncbi:hypothetical protein ACEQ8H_001122 [Pleosporales sp. CAS-2024a]